MATVSKLGSIDLFITITCNPSWPEVRAALPQGYYAADRPDIVNRVTHRLKLDSIIDDITSGCLGRQIGRIYVIEFQKRGLPHAHLLLILDEADKVRSPEDIDAVVSAELPDPSTYPKLYVTVTECNMHGPCGLSSAANMQPPCYKDGVCSKRFPKEFNPITTIAGNGYPQYAQRDDRRDVHVRGAVLDNRWVVPYNPYLSQK